MRFYYVVFHSLPICATTYWNLILRGTVILSTERDSFGGKLLSCVRVINNALKRHCRRYTQLIVVFIQFCRSIDGHHVSRSIHGHRL